MPAEDETSCRQSSSSSSAREENDFIQPIMKTRNLKRTSRDEREDDAYKVMKQASGILAARDEWNTFGTFIADNLRKMTPRHQLLAKRNITNYMFELQLKELDEDAGNSRPGSSVFDAPHLQHLAMSTSPVSVASYDSSNSFVLDSFSGYAVNTTVPSTAQDSSAKNMNTITDFLAFKDK